MIQIIPAIDLIGGRCIRLTQGDFSRQTAYPEHPVEMARRCASLGIPRLHAVDLEGARAGRPMNLSVLRDIVSETGLTVEWGGGLYMERDLDAALQAGARHLICGTAAIREPDRFRMWIDRYEGLILGADVRGTQVATHGWQETSDIDIFRLLGAFPGLREVIVTAIGRDGTLTGPETGLYRRLMARFPALTFTASGGIGSMADIRALDKAGVPRVIVGKALYEKRITLEEIASWSQNASSPV